MSGHAGRRLRNSGKVLDGEWRPSHTRPGESTMPWARMSQMPLSMTHIIIFPQWCACMTQS